MRALILAAALALGACGTAPATPVPAAAESRGAVAGFATLARFGTWEMSLAPAYTRLAGVRHRAARLLDERRIDVATAVAVQALADAARSALDASRRGSLSEPGPAQRAALGEATRLIDQAAALLEQKP